MPQKMYLEAPIEKGTFNDTERSFVAWASREVIDRDQEIILAKAFDLTNYKKNPVVLWAHDYRGKPVGRAMWIRHTDGGLKFKPAFAETAEGIETYELYKSGSLNAFSVGFIPKKWTMPDEDEKGIWYEYEADGNGGIQVATWFDVNEGWTEEKALEFDDIPVLKDLAGEYGIEKGKEPRRIYTKVELLEVSCVDVPSCPDALVEAYDNGKVKTKALVDYIKEKTAAMPDENMKAFDEGEEFNPMKPYPNEHACRVNLPGKYDRLRRNNCRIKHDNKCIDVIFGVNEGKSEIQAYRFKKDVWEAGAARSWCKEHDGTFEAASSESSMDEYETATGTVYAQWEADEEEEGIELTEEDLDKLTEAYIKAVKENKNQQEIQKLADEIADLKATLKVLLGGIA